MIEWQRIDELRTMVGNDRFGDIAQLFFREIEQGLSDLRRGMVGGTLQEQLHTLKGSAASMGFQELSRRCEAAELAAAQKRLEDADLMAISQSYNRSRLKFEEGLKQRSAA